MTLAVDDRFLLQRTSRQMPRERWYTVATPHLWAGFIFKTSTRAARSKCTGYVPLAPKAPSRQRSMGVVSGFIPTQKGYSGSHFQLSAL